MNVPLPRAVLEVCTNSLGSYSAHPAHWAHHSETCIPATICVESGLLRNGGRHLE